jgi:mono/diheme cytochrome c family protein
LRTIWELDEQGVAEGWPGEFIGGTAGGVGGAVVGATVGGPMGALVGGAAGGTAGQIAGRKLTDEQKLNEFVPLLLAGARLFMAAAPKIAQVLGKVGQAGARGVGQAAKAGAEIAAKNAGQIGRGAGAYEIGSSVADIVKEITAKVGAAVDEKTIFDLATLAFKYAIPAGIVLAILYGGKKAIDSLFADPKTPQGVAEGLDDEPEECWTCRGTGEGQFDGQSCSVCHGSGVEPRQHDDDDFDIPDDYYEDGDAWTKGGDSTTFGNGSGNAWTGGSGDAGGGAMTNLMGETTNRPYIRKVKYERADGTVEVTYELLDSDGKTIKTGMSKEIAMSVLKHYRANRVSESIEQQRLATMQRAGYFD